MITKGKCINLITGCMVCCLLAITSSCSKQRDEQDILESARSHLASGHMTAASIELRNTLKLNSQNGEARFLLGNIHFLFDNLDSAIKEYQRAERSGWSREQTQYQVARALIAQSKYSETINSITIDDTFSKEYRANILALKAWAEASIGSVRRSVYLLEQSRDHDEDALQYFITTIKLQLSGKIDGDVTITLQNAFSSHPDDDELMLLQAAHYQLTDNDERARYTLEKIINDEPSGLLTRVSRNARIDLANILISSEEYEFAMTTITPLLKRSSQDLVAIYLNSLISYNKGDYVDAERHMRKLLKLVPEHDDSQLLMGSIKFLQSDYAQAAYHLSSSLKTSPDKLDILVLLIKTYLAINDLDQAEIAIRSALDMSPGNPEILVLLSELKTIQGETIAAIDILQTAIVIHPDNTDLMKKLAEAYIDSDDFKSAHHTINEYYRISNDAKGYNRLSIDAYFRQGDIDKATVIAKELLEADPDDPEILTINGNIDASMGDFNSARDYFDKALSIDNRHFEATMGLARIEENSGNLDTAESLYSKLTEERKHKISAMMALARLADQKDDDADMLFWLKKITETSPTDTEARTILASYYFNEGQINTAQSYINEALQVSQNNHDLLILRSRIEIENNNYSSALQTLKSAQLIEPDSFSNEVLLGLVYLFLGDDASARNHLSSALKKNNEDTYVLSLLASAALMADNVDEAISYAKKAQNLEPDEALGHELEGDAWQSIGEFKRAYMSYDRAWKKRNTSAIARKLYNASSQLHDFNTAAIPLISWLDSNPDDSDIRHYLASQYIEKDMNADAISHYHLILKDDPDDVSALNNIAWLLLREDSSEALEFAARAFRLSSHDAGVLDTYGWALAKNKEYEKSLRILKRALSITPGNPEIRYHYASVLTETGNPQEARNILTELVGEENESGIRDDAARLLDSISNIKEL